MNVRDLTKRSVYLYVRKGVETETRYSNLEFFDTQKTKEAIEIQLTIKIVQIL